MNKIFENNHWLGFLGKLFNIDSVYSTFNVVASENKKKFTKNALKRSL